MYHVFEERFLTNNIKGHSNFILQQEIFADHTNSTPSLQFGVFFDGGDRFMDGSSHVIHILGGQCTHVDATTAQQVDMMLVDEELRLTF
jgi:hypothetical protein